jgi:hypothetical protein
MLAVMLDRNTTIWPIVPDPSHYEEEKTGILEEEMDSASRQCTS